MASALVGYATSPGRFDEAVDAAGVVRPAWSSLVDTLARLGGAEVEQRRRQADRLIAAQGASYLYHDEADVSRPWRLDPVPLVLTTADWKPLAEGIAQRATLLDAVLADLYGPRRLVTGGHLPVEAALTTAGYQWPVDTNQPGPTRRLVVYAADLVRTSSGEWRVLRDLTDAPSGAGYALLNRTILTRLFPEEHRELAVVRLTEFFTALRATLASLAPNDRPTARTVVLTSGLGHPSYFEHSYLAEQLGYNLAEGGDLTVRRGRVWLRSLGGLEQVDVLLRRIDDADADPLELGDGDGKGVPGLLHASRTGGVGLANALGSGAAGELTLQPFLAGACRELLGQPLRLPALETLWCGDPAQRAEVASRLDSMVVHESGPSSQPRTVFADELDERDRLALLTRMDVAPSRFVAQEKVDFATTPMLRDGAVVPGTIVLRVHAVVGPAGVTVLPGGLGRVLDPAVPIVTQSSGLAKDVWVVDGRDGLRDGRSRAETLMPQIDLRTSLPTRSAEALFWLGRYSERAEALARLARAIVVRTEEDPGLLDAGPAWASWAARGLRSARVVKVAPEGATTPDRDDPAATIRLAAELEGALIGPGGLTEQVGLLRRAASSVREFLSSTTWQVLEGLPVDLRDAGESAEALDQIVVALSALAGLAMESTVRGPSWRLLDLGRRLERALVLLGTVESMLAPVPDPVTAAARYEVVLTAHESLVAYRRRYRSDARVDAVLDLIVGDDTNPRALAFQLDRMAEHLAALPGPSDRARLEELLEASTRAAVRAPWQDLDDRPPPKPDRAADGGGSAPVARFTAVDQLVLEARGPLLDLAAAFVARWFADPAVVRRMGLSS
ncbi:MAG TPA: circularly permuted type 2 ATP-grasp protein [Acidimicrobiales bacterium]